MNDATSTLVFDPASNPARIRRASAPGKLVVAGEYSVLEGHPAWVTAVGRRAIATWNIDDERLASVDESCRIEVSAPGREKAVVHVIPGGFTIAGPDQTYFELVAQLLCRCHAQQLLAKNAALHIDSSSMSTTTSHDGSAIKLGLGSSAAVSVAALHAIAPQLEQAQAFALAFDAHMAFSEGKGSGVDVAASAFGGHIFFQRAQPKENSAPLTRTLHIERKDFTIVPVFVGHSQNTRTFLTAVDALKSEQQQTYAKILDDLATTSGDLIRSASAATGDLKNIFDDVNACRQAMHALGRAAKIDIVSESHARVATVAKDIGGAAKPSGAGGGDVAHCFVEVGDKDAMIRALSANGFTPLDLELGVPGARPE